MQYASDLPTHPPSVSSKVEKELLLILRYSLETMNTSFFHLHHVVVIVANTIRFDDSYAVQINLSADRPQRIAYYSRPS
jgi:hypothetical protein